MTHLAYKHIPFVSTRLTFFLLFIAASLPLSAQSREVEQDMFEAMRTDEKAAVIAVHYGNTDGSSCIGRFNEKLRAAFPQCTFREAWTSFPAIRQMNEQGQVKQTLTHVLQALYTEGYTHVLIQSSNIADGVEMAYIRHEAESYQGKFKQVRIGNTLLAEPADYQEAIRIVTSHYGQKKMANVLVAGGEDSENPSAFSMLDYMLGWQGYTDWLVVAEDGFPTVEQLQKQLKQRKLKKVHLIPFTFAAADEQHVGLLKQSLQKAGYKVTLGSQPLGKLDDIIDLFVNHALHARQYRTYSPLELKMQEALGR